MFSGGQSLHVRRMRRIHRGTICMKQNSKTTGTLKDLKDRLMYLMDRRDLASAAELSRMTGLTQVAIRNYMRGIKIPNAQALVKLSRALSTTADFLLSGSPLRPDRIPLLTKIPGGDPAAWTDGEFPAGFGFDDIDRGEVTDPNAFALIVDGDSMSPSINSGDIVIVSPNTPVTNRSIAAVAIGDDARTLKRIIFIDGGKILLQPDNDEYSPQLHDMKSVSFIGRVVERRQKL
jgi:repressor LexA